jgi:hypothetical protein
MREKVYFPMRIEFFLKLEKKIKFLILNILRLKIIYIYYLYLFKIFEIYL